MDLAKIYSKEDFANAVIPEWQTFVDMVAVYAINIVNTGVDQPEYNKFS